MLSFQDNVCHFNAPPDSLPASDEAPNSSVSLYTDLSDDPEQPQFLHTPCLSVLKHQYSVCHHPYNTDIMSYKNHRGIVCFAHKQKFFCHLLLHGHIQRTGRLICKKQVRMQDHGRTDSHSLVHSTRKFKRVAVQHTVTVIQTDFFIISPARFRTSFLLIFSCSDTASYICAPIVRTGHNAALQS